MISNHSADCWGFIRWWQRFQNEVEQVQPPVLHYLSEGSKGGRREVRSDNKRSRNLKEISRVVDWWRPPMVAHHVTDSEGEENDQEQPLGEVGGGVKSLLIYLRWVSRLLILVERQAPRINENQEARGRGLSKESSRRKTTQYHCSTDTSRALRGK